MSIPFFFYGSSNCSAWIVEDRIVGWGTPDAKYYFQMWRDIPSHVIYYRDLINADFLTGFNEKPILPPNSAAFRYDYLIDGDVPPGSWIQFSMGIGEHTWINDITYKLYSAEINNVKQIEINNDRIVVEPNEFFILLTNLALSVQDARRIFDHADSNILIGDDDDRGRREFNSKYYQIYLDYLKQRIENNHEFVIRLVELSGVTILGHLMKQDTDLVEIVEYQIQHWNNPTYPIIDALQDVCQGMNIAIELPSISREFISDFPDFFMNV